MKTTFTIKSFNGETITTREQARKAVAQMKNKLSNGYLSVKLVDNKESNQRWGVCVDNKASKTLSVSRKPLGNTFASMEHEIAHNAVQWLKDKPSKSVDVWVKSNYRRKCLHV